LRYVDRNETEWFAGLSAHFFLIPCRIRCSQKREDVHLAWLWFSIGKTTKATRDFLAKLAASMQGDISSAKQGYQKEISSLASQRNDARSRIEELIFKAQQDELERNSKAQKSGGSQSAGSVVYIGNDEQGNPVYRNTKTGAMETYPGVRKPAGNPVATGDWQIDPDDGQMKQVYLQNGQPGFIY